MGDFDDLVRDHAEMVRVFNLSHEELMDEAIAMLKQARVNKEWQAAINQKVTPLNHEEKSFARHRARANTLRN